MKIIFGLFFLVACTQAFAAVGVGPATVNYVYQLDSDSTVFEFSISAVNSCGSYHYKVKSPNEDVANRKFSLVLAAFSSGKRIMFADMQVCEGDRTVVSWVRLVN